MAPGHKNNNKQAGNNNNNFTSQCSTCHAAHGRGKKTKNNNKENQRIHGVTTGVVAPFSLGRRHIHLFRVLNRASARATIPAFLSPESVSRMSRKLSSMVTRLFGKSSPLPTATVIPREKHPVSRKQISRGALDVLYGLHKAGYQAWLVGGCLRDILTGGQPKDFDVVTDATPEQVRAVFRRSRIIGRRFRLVHVMVGREVVEVSTFRALGGDDEGLHARSDDGLILRDNVYGTIQEDAMRRDFTINALYYNIADFSLHDFVGSLDDLKKRRIRLIGDPAQRYREDPVRMLRAARFAAKLDFSLDRATARPIRDLADLLYQVSPARLFDETLKLFMGGYGHAALLSLQRLDLFRILFPDTARELTGERGRVWQAFIEQAARNTDHRVAEDRPVTPAFLYSVLLWPAVESRLRHCLEQGLPPAPALNRAAGEVLGEQCRITSIPRRFSTMMREIWDLQPRLAARHGARAAQVFAHPRFRAAYDFLLLREEAGEIEPGLGDWWTRYQEADEQGRQRMVSALGNPKARGRRRRRRRGPRQADD